MFDPSSRSATVLIAVHTSAITTAQWFAFATRGFSASAVSTASPSVLYIFQFPAITGFLIYLSVSAATPGSSSPARNSRGAPPPVEMCVILSATPARVTAEAESPPPTVTQLPQPREQLRSFPDQRAALQIHPLDHSR